MKFYCRLDKEDEDRKNFLAEDYENHENRQKPGKNLILT